MAGDDFLKGSEDGDDAEQEKKQPQDSALGNLPPLSNFDSSGFESDGGLPPLSSFESDTAGSDENKSMGGLPPIKDIGLETPEPAGGNIKIPPAGFDPNEFNVGQGGGEPLGNETDETKPDFQNLGGDSDFSSGTSDFNLASDSNIDTPMFDSAFGSVDSAQPLDASGPGQDQAAPVFGGEDVQFDGGGEAPIAFDDSAFDAAEDFVAAGTPAGTPASDFAPDLGSPLDTPTAGLPPMDGKPAKAKGGGSMNKLVVAGIAVAALIIGIVMGNVLSNTLTFIPNPLRTAVSEKDTEISLLESRIKRYQEKATTSDAPLVTQEELDAMLTQKEELGKAIEALTAQQTETQTKLDGAKSQLAQVETDLNSKTEEYVDIQDAFEDLENQTAIVQARQMGLVAEVDRLTGLVGKLDEANTRSRATKEALEHNIDLMLINIKEGIPLTPQKYSREGRIAAVENLKAQVEAAKWVTPALQNAYTALYLRELEIASLSEYFFARLPVTNSIGEKELKWAECLMKGNFAVYYRSLDGKNIGIYENIADEESTPSYGFIENLPERAQEALEAQVVAARVDDFEVKLQRLAQKEEIENGPDSTFQKIFNSL